MSLILDLDLDPDPDPDLDLDSVRCTQCSRLALDLALQKYGLVIQTPTNVTSVPLRHATPLLTLLYHGLLTWSP